MTDETPPVDEMHYDQLAQDALRGVIRLALERAATPEGIPGEHHFYITFKTHAVGVSVPVQVTPPSLEVRFETAPLATCRSAVVKPITASEKVKVTSVLSPAFSAVSATTTLAVGRTVSIA